MRWRLTNVTIVWFGMNGNGNGEKTRINKNVKIKKIKTSEWYGLWVKTCIKIKERHVIERFHCRRFTHQLLPIHI